MVPPSCVPGASHSSAVLQERDFISQQIDDLVKFPLTNEIFLVVHLHIFTTGNCISVAFTIPIAWWSLFFPLSAPKLL